MAEGARVEDFGLRFARCDGDAGDRNGSFYCRNSNCAHAWTEQPQLAGINDAIVKSVGRGWLRPGRRLALRNAIQREACSRREVYGRHPSPRLQWLTVKDVPARLQLRQMPPATKAAQLGQMRHWFFRANRVQIATAQPDRATARRASGHD